MGICGEFDPVTQAKIGSLIDTCIVSLTFDLATYTLIQLKAPYQHLITQRQALVDREAEEKPAEERKAEEETDEDAALKLNEEHRVKA